MAYSAVFSTTPSLETAKLIAGELVKSKAAACVNIIPGVQSVYFWQDEVCRDEELILMIKTRDSKVEDVKKVILDNHPYDVPEIISVAIKDGHSDYLNWMSEVT